MILEKLTPKYIIFNAIKDKLIEINVKKLIIIFNLKEDVYNVMVSQSDDKPLKLDLPQDQISMIKKMFIDKIKKRAETLFGELKLIIAEVDLTSEEGEIKIFVQDMKDKVTKFEY